jgi:hypothetical protein
VDLDAGTLTRAASIVAGIVWCGQMLRRWRGDLEELRTSADATERAVIVGLWLATLAVGGWVAASLVRIVVGIAGALG